jgi:hypothetical protein
MKGVFFRSDPTLYNQTQACQISRRQIIMEPMVVQIGIEIRSDQDWVSPRQSSIASYCNWLWLRVIVQGVNKSNYQSKPRLISHWLLINFFVECKHKYWLHTLCWCENRKFDILPQECHCWALPLTTSFQLRFSGRVSKRTTFEFSLDNPLSPQSWFPRQLPRKPSLCRFSHDS